MKRFYYVLFVLVLLGCNSNLKLEDIQGHWHNCYPESFYDYQSIDIIDSLIYVNRNRCIHRPDAVIREDNNLYTIAIPGNDYFYWVEKEGLIRFKDDTLIIGGNGVETSRLLRVEDTFSDLIHDFYSQIDLIDFELDTNNNSTNICTLKDQTPFINVGFPKSKFKDKFKVDSLHIQMRSLFSDIDEIVLFANSEFDCIEENEKLDFVLNCDINTSDEMINSMVSILLEMKKTNPINNIYRTCINMEEEYIGIIEIK